MTEYKCNECESSFGSEESFNQHRKAKHGIQEKHKSGGSGKIVIAVVLILIIVGGAYLFLNPPAKKEVKIVEVDHIEGSGQIEIIEFSDFQCPACGAAYPEIKKFMEQYGDKVKFAYRHFPLPNHQFAWKAGEASECADEQGKFWEFHNKLFENQKVLNVDAIKSYAEQIGLDTEKFNSCLDSGKMSSKVSAGLSEGQSLGVDSTPTFFINGEKYVGVQNFEKLKQITGVN